MMRKSPEGHRLEGGAYGAYACGTSIVDVGDQFDQRSDPYKPVARI